MSRERRVAVVGFPLVVVLAGSVLLSCSGGSSPSKVYRVSANMDARGVVTPAGKRWHPPRGLARAHGTLLATLDAGTHELHWRLSYGGTQPTTLPIADIHLGPPGKFGALLARLCGPCTTPRGVTTLNPSVTQAIVRGTTWVTIITPRYPNGVMRGQISAR